MRSVVFLTEESPFPSSSGGKLRDASVVRALADAGYEIDLVCLGPESGDAPPGVHVHALPLAPIPLWRRALSPFRPYVLNGFQPAVIERLRELHRPGRVLWLSRLATAKYLTRAKALGYRVVLDEHNVESSLLLRTALRSPALWPQVPKAWLCRRAEARFCAQAGKVITVSSVDADRVRRMTPRARIEILPNTIDTARFAGCASGEGTELFFSGTLDYFPNREGLLWFVEKVLPRLQTRLGADCPRLHVAGARPDAALLAILRAAGAMVESDPVDMLPHLARARLVVVPLLSGGGTRLKILEALAADKAVVSTSRGAEGLGLRDGREISIADDAETFAAQIEKHWRDPAGAQVLAHAGRALVQEKFDWHGLRQPLERILS